MEDSLCYRNATISVGSLSLSAHLFFFFQLMEAVVLGGAAILQDSGGDFSPQRDLCILHSHVSGQGSSTGPGHIFEISTTWVLPVRYYLGASSFHGPLHFQVGSLTHCTALQWEGWRSLWRVRHVRGLQFTFALGVSHSHLFLHAFTFSHWRAGPGFLGYSSTLTFSLTGFPTLFWRRALHFQTTHRRRRAPLTWGLGDHHSLGQVHPRLEGGPQMGRAFLSNASGPLGVGGQGKIPFWAKFLGKCLSISISVHHF